MIVAGVPTRTLKTLVEGVGYEPYEARKLNAGQLEWCSPYTYRDGGMYIQSYGLPYVGNGIYQQLHTVIVL